MEEALHEAKDQALAANEDALVVEALASNVAMKAIEAFRVGEEYYLEVLKLEGMPFDRASSF